MWNPFRKEKPKKYAVAKLIENAQPAKVNNTSPLLSKKQAYIKYLGRIKQAIVAKDTKSQKFFNQYLSANGLEPQTTLSGCDKLIKEIEGWQQIPPKNG